MLYSLGIWWHYLSRRLSLPDDIDTQVSIILAYSYGARLFSVNYFWNEVSFTKAVFLQHKQKETVGSREFSVPFFIWLQLVNLSVFQDVTRSGLVVGHRRFETIYRSHLQGSRSCLILEDGSDNSPETSVANYTPTPPNTLAQRRSPFTEPRRKPQNSQLNDPFELGIWSLVRSRTASSPTWLHFSF
jgi:hypothetical protein